jgi:hypothetical protein
MTTISRHADHASRRLIGARKGCIMVDTNLWLRHRG